MGHFRRWKSHRGSTQRVPKAKTIRGPTHVQGLGFCFPLLCDAPADETPPNWTRQSGFYPILLVLLPLSHRRLKNFHPAETTTWHSSLLCTQSGSYLLMTSLLHCYSAAWCTPPFFWLISHCLVFTLSACQLVDRETRSLRGERYQGASGLFVCADDCVLYVVISFCFQLLLLICRACCLPVFISCLTWPSCVNTSRWNGN